MKGTKVGSYIIDSKIGEGGMGVVYLAKHERMNRQAVVKVLHKHLAENPEMAKRFENEANAAASIGHPGIVQVFDIGQQKDGSLYIVMELLGGESLQDRLERMGKLPIEQAITIVSQCADALAAAHATGIVHRDLKPDNIFLVPDSVVPGGERAKLLDFGIAKLQVEGMATVGTKMGTLMGTPPYMSPEQCLGAGSVNHLSDIYALGCILFQLVTGKTPFVGRGAGDYIVAHRTKAPPLLRSLRPEAPRELEEIVATLLEKNPADRFATAGALVAALGAVTVRGSASKSVANAVSAQGLDRSSNVNAASAVQAAPLSQPEAGRGYEPPTTLGLNAGERRIASQVSSTHGGAKSKGALIGVAIAAVAAAAIAGVVILGGDSDKPTTVAQPVTGQSVTGRAVMEQSVTERAVTEQSVTGQSVSGVPASTVGVDVKVSRLTLSVEPADADVFVGGNLVEGSAGRAESHGTGRAGILTIELPRDMDTTLEVRSPGYESHKQTIHPSSDTSLTVALEASGEAVKMPLAQARRDAWFQSPVKIRLAVQSDSISGRASFKMVNGSARVTSKLDGVFVACGVDFDEDGNPSMVRDCSAKGENFRIKPTSIRCAVSGTRFVCKATRVPTRVDKESVRMTYQIARSVIDADAIAK